MIPVFHKLHKLRGGKELGGLCRVLDSKGKRCFGVQGTPVTKPNVFPAAAVEGSHVILGKAVTPSLFMTLFLYLNSKSCTSLGIVTSYWV